MRERENEREKEREKTETRERKTEIDRDLREERFTLSEISFVIVSQYLEKIER